MQNIIFTKVLNIVNYEYLYIWQYLHILKSTEKKLVYYIEMLRKFLPTEYFWVGEKKRKETLREQDCQNGERTETENKKRYILMDWAIMGLAGNLTLEINSLR